MSNLGVINNFKTSLRTRVDILVYYSKFRDEILEDHVWKQDDVRMPDSAPLLKIPIKPMKIDRVFIWVYYENHQYEYKYTDMDGKLTKYYQENNNTILVTINQGTSRPRVQVNGVATAYCQEDFGCFLCSSFWGVGTCVGLFAVHVGASLTVYIGHHIRLEIATRSTNINQVMQRFHCDVSSVVVSASSATGRE
jgi:hypothetical protein